MKRRQELHGLSDDHHTALIVALRCRRAAAGQGDLSIGGAGAQALKLDRTPLREHFRVEEDLLVPALREMGETAMAERILAEHRELAALLAGEHPVRETVAAFADLLDRHIRYEERVVFEQTQDRLSSAVAESIREARPHDRSCSLS